MKHTISLTNKGHVEVCLIGPILLEHVTTLGQRLVIFTTQLEDMGKDLRIIINSLQATELKQDAYALTMVILKHTPFKKTALIDRRKDIIKKHIKEITHIPVAEKIRVYETHEEAVLWLGE